MKFTVFALLCLFLSSTVNAGLVVYADFEFGWGGSFNYSGNLVAEDGDDDGFIRLKEVLSISETYGGHNSLQSLFDIGDIDIQREQWLANGESWPYTPDLAYMTFDKQAWSCTTFNGCDLRFTFFKAVPEPASLALFGLCLFGFVYRQKKHKHLFTQCGELSVD